MDGVDRQISLTVVELGVGNTEAAHAYALRAEEDAGNSGCNYRRRWPVGRRAAVLLAGGAGAPAYQLWAAPLVLAAIGVAGVSYLLVAKPHRRLSNS